MLACRTEVAKGPVYATANEERALCEWQACITKLCESEMRLLYSRDLITSGPE